MPTSEPAGRSFGCMCEQQRGVPLERGDSTPAVYLAQHFFYLSLVRSEAENGCQGRMLASFAQEQTRDRRRVKRVSNTSKPIDDEELVQRLQQVCLAFMYFPQDSRVLTYSKIFLKRTKRRTNAGGRAVHLSKLFRRMSNHNMEVFRQIGRFGYV